MAAKTPNRRRIGRCSRRSDFDELFNNPVPAAEDPSDARTAGREAAQGASSPSGTAAPPAPVPEEVWGTHADPDVAVEPADVPRGGVPAFQPQPPPRLPGIVLSPAKATILTVVVVIGLAVAFAAGLLVGRFLLPTS